MTGIRIAHHGAVLAGVKAKPLRGGLRPALTPAPVGTNGQLSERRSRPNKIKNH